MKFFSHHRGRRAAHARKAVAWLLATLTVLNVGLALLLDQSGPALRDPEYHAIANALRAKRVETPAAKLTLVLGSSRVALGLDAGRLSTPSTTVFNFGMPGAGPYMMNIYWDRLTAEGIRPDSAVIELMHPFYNAAHRQLDVGFLDSSRLSFSEAKGLIDDGYPAAGPLRRLGIARVFPGTRHGLDLAEHLGLEALTARRDKERVEYKADDFGYRPRFYPPEGREKLRTLAHGQYNPFYPTFKPNPVPINRLRDLIRKMQAGGVNVTLLLTPEGSEFRSLMSPEMATAINEFVAGMVAEFAVKVIDARDWLPDEAFYDQHHLLPDGGQAFAERLKPLLP